jgi:hypothetical protein
MVYKKAISNRLLLSLLLGTQIGVATATIDEAGPTYTTYPISSIPTLSAAGSKSTDPTFGTDIMRLTDGADGSTSCVNAYSYWPVFNSDSTRLAVWCTFSSGPTKTIFYTFNPSAFTFSGYQAVTGFDTDTIWSGVNPDVIFAKAYIGGNAYFTALNSYNVATGTTTLIKDFTATLPASHGLQQLSRSLDDDIWAFTVVTGSTPVGYMVWKRSTNQILLNQSNSGSNLVDEVQIDKSGRYLNVQNKNGNAQVWDLQTSTVLQMTYSVDGYYHEDTGHGLLLSDCAYSPGLCFRRMNLPHTAVTILPLPSWTQIENHFTMLADNEGWGLVTNENPNFSITFPFHGEIFQVATNGSGKVRHLVHHNSSAASYLHNAFGNISRDGRFLAWTSDWGNSSGRTDVYLAQITPANNSPTPISGPAPALDLSAAYSDGGYAYLKEKVFGTLPDASGYYTRSILRLFENGIELKPPHAAHADIRSIGLGQFSHWFGGGIESLRFAASDNTDPRSNGRTYTYNVPDTQVALDVSGATSDSGYAYIIGKVFGNLADSNAFPHQSTLRLFENGVELTQGHALHADIRSIGLGRFSHYKDTGGSEALRFSASDNTDPRANGRTYTYIIDTIIP